MSRDDPGDATSVTALPPVLREPLALRTEWQPFLPRWDILMTTDGLTWRRKGGEPLWAPWVLVGGITITGGRAPGALILALDGSELGSIPGAITLDGAIISLAHAATLLRPDLFVEVPGTAWGNEGCIRRDVADAEALHS